jgi:hypothetical protein
MSYKYSVPIFLGALAALFALYRGLQQVHREGLLNRSALIVVVVGVATNLGTVASGMLGAGMRAQDSRGTPYVIYPAWKDVLEEWSSRGATAVLLFIALAAIPQRASRAALCILALMLFAVATLAGLLEGDALTSGPQLLLFAALAAAWLSGGGRGAVAGAASIGALLSILSGMFALLQGDTVSLPCAVGGKCGPLGLIYAGVMGHANGLALALALSLPFVWLAFSGGARLVLVVQMSLMIWATGSRTGTGAVLVVLVFLAVFRPSLATSNSRPRGRFALLILLPVLLAASLITLFPWAPSAFTGRAYLWQLAQRRAGGGDLILGRGPFDWASLNKSTGEINLAATYSVHNQFLDVLYVAGGIGLTLFVVLIYMLFRKAGVRNWASLVAVLLPVFWLGITERAWSVGRADWLTFSFVATLLMFATRDRSSYARSDGQATRRHTSDVRRTRVARQATTIT